MKAEEPISVRGLRTRDDESLIRNRIRKILVICSNYGAFILEEYGQI